MSALRRQGHYLKAFGAKPLANVYAAFSYVLGKRAESGLPHVPWQRLKGADDFLSALAHDVVAHGTVGTVVVSHVDTDSVTYLVIKQGTLTTKCMRLRFKAKLYHILT